MKLFGIVIGFSSANPLLNYVQTRIITLEKTYEKKLQREKLKLRGNQAEKIKEKIFAV